MKIVPYDPDNWKKDHPTGNVAFQHMLKGEPESPDNFMYILGRQDGDFYMPRHRHNFEQIRLPVKGDMTIGGGLILREGEVGYFPEGTPYGPQNDPLGNAPPGERLQLVLQFGGASGYGFMSIEQRRQAMAELAKLGQWVGPNFRWPDGKEEWGLNTIWKHVFGVSVKYPRPRYRAPLIADPKSFHWLPVAGSSGVERKYFGAFSERAAWVEMVRLQPRAVWSSADPAARRLLVVTAGEGTAEGQAIRHLTALQAEAGETLSVATQAGVELFVIGLPPIERPAVESDQYDTSEALPEEHAA